MPQTKSTTTTYEATPFQQIKIRVENEKDRTVIESLFKFQEKKGIYPAFGIPLQKISVVFRAVYDAKDAEKIIKWLETQDVKPKQEKQLEKKH